MFLRKFVMSIETNYFGKMLTVFLDDLRETEAENLT